MAALGVAAAGLMLTGCNQLSLEEAQGASHRVVETGSDFWTGESWSYIGPGGQETPLAESCGDFWGHCWTDPDGIVEFRYSKGKHGISSERMILDGTEWSMECHSTDFWSGKYVCAAI